MRHNISLPLGSLRDTPLLCLNGLTATYDDMNTPEASNNSKPEDSDTTHNYYFKQAYEMQERISKVLYSWPRSETQAEHLFDIIKSFSFIQTLRHEIKEGHGLSRETILDIIKKMKYIRVPQGKVIYRQGEASDNQMFIVYSGEVGLVLKERDLISEQNLQRLASYKRIMKLEGNPTYFKEFDPLTAGLIQSYVTSSRVNHKLRQDLMDKNLVPVPEEVNNRYKELLSKFGTVVKVYIIFMRNLKRRLRVSKQVEKFGVVRDRIIRGGYFGESGMISQKNRDETIVALSNCELLIVESKDLNEIWHEFYEAKRSIRDFIFQSFPKLDGYKSSSVVESLTHAPEEQNYTIGNTIASEDAVGQYFYIVYSGSCEVSKSIGLEESGLSGSPLAKAKSLVRVKTVSYKKAVLTTISKGTFFGEEILFSPEGKYHYTVKVLSSKALVLAVNINRFAVRFPKEVFDALKKAYNPKEKRYTDILRNLMVSSKYESFNVITDGIQSVDQPDQAPTLTVRKPLKLKKKNMAGSSQPAFTVPDEYPFSLSWNQTVDSFKNLKSPKVTSPSNKFLPNDQNGFASFRDRKSHVDQEISPKKLPSIQSALKLDNSPGFESSTGLHLYKNKSSPRKPNGLSFAGARKSPNGDLMNTTSSLSRGFENKDGNDILMRRLTSVPTEEDEFDYSDYRHQNNAFNSTGGFNTKYVFKSTWKEDMLKRMSSIRDNAEKLTNLNLTETLSPKGGQSSSKINLDQTSSMNFKSKLESYRFDMGDTKPGRTYSKALKSELINSHHEEKSPKALKESTSTVVSHPNKKPVESARIKKISKKLAKIQKIHLYTRSVSEPENIFKPRIEEKNKEQILRIPLVLEEDELVDTSERNSNINASKDSPTANSPTTEKGHVRFSTFKRANDTGFSIISNIKSVDKAANLKPIVFPLPDKKFRKGKQSLALMSYPRQEQSMSPTPTQNDGLILRFGSPSHRLFNKGSLPHITREMKETLLSNGETTPNGKYNDDLVKSEMISSKRVEAAISHISVNIAESAEMNDLHFRNHFVSK